MTAARRVRLALGLVARETPHEAQLARLRRAFADPALDVPALVRAAEEEGLAPLLHRHVVAAGLELAPEPRATLRGLVLRHANMARLRGLVVPEVLRELERGGIASMLLKGAAAAEVLYGDRALRPMRDVDLLVGPRDVEAALAAARRAGFEATALPGAPHHAPPLARRDARGTVSLEIHHRLGDELGGRGRDLDELLPRAREIRAGGARAWVPGPVDFLAHVARHTFRVPMGAEWFRLVGVADLVTGVERWHAELDWAAIARDEPELAAVVPLLDALTPFDAAVRSALPVSRRRPLGVGLHYYGWPRVPPPGGARARLAWAVATLAPSEHWVRLRHGGGRGARGALRSYARHWRELAGLLGAS